MDTFLMLWALWAMGGAIVSAMLFVSDPSLDPEDWKGVILYYMIAMVFVLAWGPLAAAVMAYPLKDAD